MAADGCGTWTVLKASGADRTWQISEAAGYLATLIIYADVTNTTSQDPTVSEVREFMDAFCEHRPSERLETGIGALALIMTSRDQIK